MFILPCLLNWFSKNITDTQGIRYPIFNYKINILAGITYVTDNL